MANPPLLDLGLPQELEITRRREEDQAFIQALRPKPTLNDDFDDMGCCPRRHPYRRSSTIRRGMGERILTAVSVAWISWEVVMQIAVHTALQAHLRHIPHILEASNLLAIPVSSNSSTSTHNRRRRDEVEVDGKGCGCIWNASHKGRAYPEHSRPSPVQRKALPPPIVHAYSSDLLVLLFASLWVKIASWRPTKRNRYEHGQEDRYLCGGSATSGHRLPFISRPLLLFVHAGIYPAHQDPSRLIRSRRPLASSPLFGRLFDPS
ncbi:hypothetical protein BC629DRAFT_1443105 [Irpex lacteus]|nr:hypothetical protein BC629DRAFT_1443105 [Irpex lacteus]